MLGKIWIVSGATGEYSDRTEWLVKAFCTEKRAADFVDKLDDYMRKEKAKFGPNIGWDNRSAIAENNPYDPNMRMDYTGTNYYYEEVELEL